MRKPLRAVLGVTACLSGWALVPFVSLPLQAFGWENFAGAYAPVFGDGFETGDTSRWSLVVGGIVVYEVSDPDEFSMSFRIGSARAGLRENQIMRLASGLSERRVPTFVLEARRHDARLEVRARAMSASNVWVESPWRAVDADNSKLTVEWRRSLEQTEDGLLYVSVDDDLRIWLVDLDNWLLPLRTLEVPQFDRTPAIYGIAGTLGAVDGATAQP